MNARVPFLGVASAQSSGPQNFFSTDSSEISHAGSKKIEQKYTRTIFGKVPYFSCNGTVIIFLVPAYYIFKSAFYISLVRFRLFFLEYQYCAMRVLENVLKHNKNAHRPHFGQISASHIKFSTSNQPIFMRFYELLSCSIISL